MEMLYKIPTSFLQDFYKGLGIGGLVCGVMLMVGLMLLVIGSLIAVVLYCTQDAIEAEQQPEAMPGPEVFDEPV